MHHHIHIKTADPVKKEGNNIRPVTFRRKSSLSRREDERWRKLCCGKKTILTSPIQSIDFGIYFGDIGLGVEELFVEAPPALKKKKTTGVEKRLVLTHSVEEMRELLVAGLEFHDLGMVK